MLIKISNQKKPWDPEEFKRDVKALQKKLAKAQKRQEKRVKWFLKNFDKDSDSDRVTKMTQVIKQHKQECEKYSKMLFDMCERFAQSQGRCEKLGTVMLEDCAASM